MTNFNLIMPCMHITSYLFVHAMMFRILIIISSLPNYLMGDMKFAQIQDVYSKEFYKLIHPKDSKTQVLVGGMDVEDLASICISSKSCHYAVAVLENGTHFTAYEYTSGRPMLEILKPEIAFLVETRKIGKHGIVSCKKSLNLTHFKVYFAFNRYCDKEGCRLPYSWSSCTKMYTPNAQICGVAVAKKDIFDNCRNVLLNKKNADWIYLSERISMVGCSSPNSDWKDDPHYYSKTFKSQDGFVYSNRELNDLCDKIKEVDSSGDTAAKIALLVVLLIFGVTAVALQVWKYYKLLNPKPNDAFDFDSAVLHGGDN